MSAAGDGADHDVEPDGTYVLMDVGPRVEWPYVFVPSES
jgi:hypothetical protein